MVRPEMRQLSALKLPWQNPTRIQFAARSAKAWATRGTRFTAVSTRESARASGNSRSQACFTRSHSSSRCAGVAPVETARRAKRSTWPTRKNDGATRHVMAHCSSEATSGSVPPASWARNWATRRLRIGSGKEARRGSFSSTPPLPAPAVLEYHARLAVSPLETRDSARVVGTPRANMASDAKNSRTEDRSTARPSAPRQNGVVPAPLSCSSHLAPPGTTTSPTEMARPSP
mmetsp:Transcript_22795/g.77099  ORF Transcript_22795/g.77099 Transcript_22795/m.77099 type:complete len:231 (+) Transcript_22795:979-1671(+)